MYIMHIIIVVIVSWCIYFSLFECGNYVYIHIYTVYRATYDYHSTLNYLHVDSQLCTDERLTTSINMD